MSPPRILSVAALGWLVALVSLAGDAAADPAPVGLGAAEGFAVIAGSTVTSAGVSTITGDLAVSPGTAVTGFPPGQMNGTIHAADGTAVQAKAGLATAYADAVGRPPAVPITGDLGGRTLTAGVYAAGAALTLAGTLTLDGQGNRDAVFVLQAGSTLGTGAGSHVNLAGGAQSCNVFWQVGTSATLGAASGLAGTILASTSITMGDGVVIDGRALARDGAVTLINDTVSAAHCAGLLSNTAPAIAAFGATLHGLTQTVHTAVGAWSVTDATGTNAGYSLTVAATSPTVDGSTLHAGTGASLTLTPTSATAASGNSAGTGPVAKGVQTLGGTAVTIDDAVAGTGQGEWDFAADSGVTKNLSVVIPGDASPGSYSSTLIFTTAPPAA
jgi:hypothetical protein